MAFHEILFPEDIPYGTSFGPAYNTAVVDTPNKNRYRTSFTPNEGILTWKLKKELLSIADMKVVYSFVRGRRGKYHGFRLKHWQDYKKVDEPLPYVNGSSTLQLQYLYDDEVNPEIQIVLKPVLLANIDTYNPDITLKKDTAGNGVYLNFPSSENWSLNRNTGKITLTDGPADDGTQFKWSGSFNFPVTFDTDNPIFEVNNFNGFDMNDINFVELKNP